MALSCTTEQFEILNLSDPTYDAYTLETFFQGEAQPVEIGDSRVYFLVQPHISWQDFLALFDETAFTDGSLAGWKACRLCASIWGDISVLANADGEPVFLGQDPETYPLPVRQAVRAYQRAFRLSPVRDHVFFRAADAVRHSGCNLGKETAGVNANLVPYKHIFLRSNLDGNSLDRATQMNALLHQETPLLEQFLRDWSPDVINVILARYEARGENAPGYKVNIGGLRFLHKLQEELHAQRNERQRRITVLRHLLTLFRGPQPANALGAIHVFSNGSNLAACRDASSEDAFWAILQERYEPTTYRQPTSAPTEGQVKEALKLVGGDLSCFEREYLSIKDPRVTSRAIWREMPRDATRITAEELLAAARKTAPAAASAKATCFDGACTGGRLTVSQFEIWLSTLEPTSVVEWQVPSTVTPIQVAIPTTEKGLEMLKLQASWVVPGFCQAPAAVGVPGGWLRIPMITPHVSRWCKDGTLAAREHAVVCDGLILQAAHTWEPQGSCLFAEFFNGEYHGLNHTRQALQHTLRMRKPDSMDASEVFRGLLLSVRNRPGPIGLVPQFDAPQRFRVRRSNGTVQTVDVL